MASLFEQTPTTIADEVRPTMRALVALAQDSANLGFTWYVDSAGLVVILVSRYDPETQRHLGTTEVTFSPSELSLFPIPVLLPMIFQRELEAGAAA